VPSRTAESPFGGAMLDPRARAFWRPWEESNFRKQAS